MPVYMKYGNISGDVTTPGYQGWIEISSFSFGIGRPMSGSGGPGKVSIGDIDVTKATDVATVSLVKEITAGSVTKSVTIVFLKLNPNGAQEPYFEFALDDTLITKYSFGPAAAAGATEVLGQPLPDFPLPNESLSIAFNKVNYTYIPQPNG
jgi:type VI secretion system secreted protein Hcp